MIYDYEPAEGEGEGDHGVGSLNPDNEYVHAKAFLQKASSATGENLYDHLSDVLNKILSERPENIIDFFEEYSRKVKERRFKSALDHLEDIYVPKGRYELSTKMMALLKPITVEEPSTVDPADLELADMAQNDMLQLLFYFEHAGLGLPRTEMFCLMVAMKKLIHTEPIGSIRFWGIIYGLYSNYYVVETELKEEEYMRRNENFEDEEPTVIDENAVTADINAAHKIMEQDEITVRLHQLAHEQQLGGEDSKFPRTLPPLPANPYEKPPRVPPEPSGVGVNAKVYYVTNDLTGPWEQLPDLTPEEIRIARQVHKSFTGKLEQEIITYPEFPGKERNYLRAQIARISSGTQISPLGFYTFGADMGGEGDEEEEPVADEEGEGPKTHYKINPKYDPVPLKDLIDGSMSFWVHHTQYILPQGRTSWWNPTSEPEQPDEAEDEAQPEEDEDETKPKVAGPEPETGPPLLTPLSEDAQIESVPAWSVRASSKIMEEFAIAVVRSHLWPGAYCFATQGKLFQNIYLGNGLKYLVTNFSPTPLPPIQQDYPPGPEIMEMFDPTGAEEEDWRIAHLPKPKPVGPEEGEEEEEEEEDEEDDDDDEED